MAAYTTNAPKQSKPKKSGGCNCKEEPEKKCSCCQTVCFDRPQYHCGHLLSSEDLTLQLHYDIEKNKLRNRTLFGCGVVCGLRLSCDPNCDGAIRVSKGYAIDGCGNDLVVCESERFNVMARLRAKKLLDCPPPEPDPCDDKQDPRDPCPDKQCFYIVACFSEEDDVFETPFQAGCDPKPAACVPTRIHERVSFDVVSKPASCGCARHRKHTAAAPSSVRRLEDGPVGEYLHAKGGVLRSVFQPNETSQADQCEVLCNLKKLFRHQLKEHPAEYTCDLTRELEAICCPEQNNDFQKNMADAMTVLLNLIYQYSSEAALGNLVFDCCEPCEAGCVVLGAVYVENGKLRRVCNTPREYVWTFQNFWKIFQFELVERATAEMASRANDGRKPACCPKFVFDGKLLQQRAALSRDVMSQSVQAFPDAIDGLVQAAAASFNFADALNIPAGQFDPQLLRELNFSVREEGALEPSAEAFILRDLTSSFMRKAMIRPGDKVVVHTSPNDPDKKLFIERDFAAAIGILSTGDSSNAVNQLNERLTQRERQIDEMKKMLDDAHASIETLKTKLGGGDHEQHS